MRAFAVRGLLVLLTSYGNTYASRMKSIPVTRARKDLYRLLDEVTEDATDRWDTANRPSVSMADGWVNSVDGKRARRDPRRTEE